MKVLHLLQSSTFSGAENVVCQIIGLLKNEYNIEFIYCSPDGQIRNALLERGIYFSPLRSFSREEVKKAVEIEKPDIIHAHDMRASFIASLACGNVRLISHIHNNNFNSRGLSVKSFAYLLPAFKSSHIFYVSNSSYKGYYFHSLFKKKSSVLYNIIDVKQTMDKMLKDKEIYHYDIVYLGRLTFQKNPQRLMKILKKCVEINRKLKIAIVGTGDLEKETKETCKQLGLDENVTFVGFMLNPLRILRDSKVMVMSSRWEGTPMCALEAMALGVPIVSTPVDGIIDLVINGETGYLSNIDDELASHIVNIVKDETLHDYMSKKSLEQSATINNIQKFKQRLLDVYGNVL